MLGMGVFRVEGLAMRYSRFVPRLFNLCKSLGFESHKIMPSRAFCSDENQGFPIILLTKHFGTFPFNHGMVGGVVATDRHGPHADHGKDIVIIQASHVGYDPDTGEFGKYRRLQTEDQADTTTCGKICSITNWYQEEYRFAQENILLINQDGEHRVAIDNQLLDPVREAGLFPDLSAIIQSAEPVQVRSTAKVFRAAPSLVEKLGPDAWKEGKGKHIGNALNRDMFRFRHPTEQADSGQEEGRDHLQRNLGPAMPAIVTSAHPALDAARYNTQVEFDRTFRTLKRNPDYMGKNLLFISGLNVDISPQPGQIFPMTEFVPWAAYIQLRSGKRYTLEQPELYDALMQQSIENPDEISLDDAIRQMGDRKEIVVKVNPESAASIR